MLSTLLGFLYYNTAPGYKLYANINGSSANIGA